MIHVYFVDKTKLSGRRLVDELNKLGIITTGNHPDNGIPKDIKYLIRWGCSLGSVPAGIREINSKEALMLVIDKLKSLNVLNKAKLGIPRLYDYKNISFPCIIRPINHMRQEEFLICYTRNDFPMEIGSGYYITELFLKKFDYRIFIFRNIFIRGYVWKPRPDFKNPSEVIRTDDFGWKMHQTTDIPRKVIIESFKAVEALKLDFGGVDIGIDSTGKTAIYEINSAPYLNDLRSQLFAQAIANSIR